MAEGLVTLGFFGLLVLLGRLLPWEIPLPECCGHCGAFADGKEWVACSDCPVHGPTATDIALVGLHDGP